MKMGLAAMLLVVLLGAVPAQGDSFDLGYVARSGDFNSDGRQDIYLDYKPNLAMIPLDDLLIPIPTTRRKVDDFVLQQNSSGGFDLVSTLTSSQTAELAQCVLTTIEVVLGDMNVDRVLDVVLKNVGTTIPGATDAIVFAPTAQGAPPMALKSVDALVSRFVNDVNGFAGNPGHYYDNAWLPAAYIVPWPVNVYECNGTWYAFLSGDPEEGDAWVYCQYVYTYIDYFVFEVEVLDTNNYSVPAYWINQTLAPYIPETGTVTIPAADASAVIQQLTQVFGVRFAPDYDPEPVDVEPEKDTRTRWIMSAIRILGRASVLIGGVLYPNETASDDEAKPYYPYKHYSYWRRRFELLAGLRPGSWVTPDNLVSGATAQQLYALPIHYPDDAPPDRWFLVYVADAVPRFIHQEGPVTYTNFGITRTRTGGGTGVKLYWPTPPTQITGPFELPPVP